MKPTHCQGENSLSTFSFEAIGYIRSCFPEKFGIPRQPGLVPEAEAVLEIKPPYSKAEAFNGLDQFSHVWILFVFHQCYPKRWQSTVRPPRLGGNKRVGVFASRSGFRPNTIGQSVVTLVDVSQINNATILKLRGVDILDGSPVLDIKPYIPYADSIPEATAGYAPMPPRKHEVGFSTEAEATIATLSPDTYPNLQALIIGLLAQDPRPAYKAGRDTNEYGMCLWDLNVRFSFGAEHIWVRSIEKRTPNSPTTACSFQPSG